MYIMPLLSLIIEPTSERKPITLKLSHPLISQTFKLKRITVIKAATASYDGNYYRLTLPFLCNGRQTFNNLHNGNLIIANQPNTRSFEATFDTEFKSDNVNEVFQALIQEADGTVVDNTTVKAFILNYEYQTNRHY